MKPNFKELLSRRVALRAKMKKNPPDPREIEGCFEMRILI